MYNIIITAFLQKVLYCRAFFCSPIIILQDNAEENNEEAEDELCGMHAAPLGSSSKSALTKTVGGKSLLVTRANSSFDEIDGGADNEGAVLAYSTTVVPPEDTALDDEGYEQFTSMFQHISFRSL